jgi:hypothetical protein
MSPQTLLKLGAVNQDSSFVIQLSQWVFFGIYFSEVEWNKY